MPTMYDVPVNVLIEEIAKDLKNVKEIKAPEWATYCKTGVHKERPPIREDWWHVRAAAILRNVRRLGPVGVQKLRTKYGGKKNRGHQTEHTFKGSGNIIRKILQQLESAGLIKKGDKGVHKGRVITPKGTSLMDKAALRIYKSLKEKMPEQPKQETIEKPAEVKKPVAAPKPAAPAQPAPQ
jgi:small subunit ribosomal protein S19e